ncbi:MAG: peptidase domain-containing ABC transporter [Nannocystaceae bacterium]|nr:peptidase domain-containing ABC transporter [bacterium]
MSVEDVLSRLGTRRPRLEFVQQMTQVECAPACLAMVLGGFGKRVSLDTLRRDFGDVTQGVDAGRLLDVARGHGLIGRVYRVEPHELGHLDPGAILHWEFDHYVVLARHGKRQTHILDPASGERQVSRADLGRSLTGIAIQFERDESFAASTERHENPLRRYFRLISEFRGAVISAVALSVFGQFLGFGAPLAMALAVEDFIPRGDARALVTLVIALAVLASCRALTRFVRSRVLIGLAARMDARLRVSFVNHIVRLPLAFTATRTNGDLQQRINSMGVLRDVLSAAALSTMLDAAVAVLFLAALLSIHAGVGLAAVAIAGFHAATVALGARRRRHLMTELMIAEAKCQSRQIELVSGLETLKAMGRETSMAAGWAEAQVDQLNANARSNTFDANLAALQDLAQLAIPAVLLGIAGISAATGSLSLGTLFALAALIPGFVTPVASLLETLEQMVGAQSVAERLNDVYEHPLEQAPERSFRRLAVKGHIELRDVRFGYDAAGTVLAGIDLDIEPGTSVAIVGPSGCGKSTLARCLLGLYPPRSGLIRIDGVDVEQLDKVHLRRQLGFVGQDPRLFAGTIRDNITMGAPGTCEDTILWAARLAQIDDDIAQLPMGYDTPVAEGGSSLSGGQRQRLAIARAVIGRPRILVLDEATSALDTRSERMIQRALETLECTRVVIAHRLSTVANADCIVVMDHGRIIERGTHDELLAAGSMYTALWAAQHEHSGQPRGLAC